MYQVTAAGPQLKKYVQYFWLGEVDLVLGQTFTHIATASSGIELLFYYQGDFSNTDGSKKVAPATLYGQTDRHDRFTAGCSRLGIFGVRLYPYAIPALLSVPASALTNAVADIDSLLGKAGSLLAERVFEAATFEQKIAAVSTFLQSRIRELKRKYRLVEHAVTLIHSAKGKVDPTTLVAGTYLSPRQFERNFKELSGFNLKAYLKIVRFENALRILEQETMPLTGLALSCGYYDQAHFNRDFKQFTGYTPSGYKSLIATYPA
jgi:AraC-like DNA-binding protein